MDVYETEDSLVVRVEVAGMREEAFTVDLDGRSLAIRGSRSDTPERRAYHQMEIHFGEFLIEMELPSDVEPENVEAFYQDGFLRVVLPKVKPRQIHID
jgi:HSP20 family protein